MAPRLAHKKSRKGCQRCKARRVKCDEKHPSCSSCSKHEVPCVYSDPFHHVPNPGGTAAQPSTAESEGTSSSSPAPSTVVGPASPYSEPGEVEDFEPEERRALELRLLHHYVSIVTYTFPACDNQKYRDMWAIDAVRIAFDFPFLFNTMLAISALHLVSDTGRQSYFYARDSNTDAVERVTRAPHAIGTKTDMARAHRIYMNLAIRQQREAIQNFNSENSDAIFIASVLLAYQSIKLIPDTPASAPYDPPIQWMRMSKAIYAVVEAVLPQMRADSVIAFILKLTISPDFRDIHAIFDPAHREPFKELLDWDKHPEQHVNGAGGDAAAATDGSDPAAASEPLTPEIEAKMRRAYEHALSYVGGTYQDLLDKEAPRRILRRIMYFPVLVPARFIDMVEQRRPRALAILAHHMALAQAVEEHWWVKGLAEREVAGIQSVMPPEWQWAMHWPINAVSAGKQAAAAAASQESTDGAAPTLRDLVS